MNLVPPPGKVTGGEVVFYQLDANPVSLQALPIPQMRNYRGHEIAMIFQEPMTSLNPVFTCGNQVQEAIMLHLNFTRSEAKARALALFEKVKLPDPARIFRSYPHQLSGGQKQRVMIAMAISCEPSILIADEPTTALDVTVQAHILELLDELKKDKEMSMVFITHDLGVVAEIADRVLVMYNGKNR
jgi:peptide/nickel transport system ATP-binding protein